MYAITFSDIDSSNSDSEESCEGEGNYSAFMTIAPVQSSNDLNMLVEELGENTELESMGIVKEFDDEEDEEQWDYKKPTIPSLRRLMDMQKWLKQPLRK